MAMTIRDIYVDRASEVDWVMCEELGDTKPIETGHILVVEDELRSWVPPRWFQVLERTPKTVVLQELGRYDTVTANDGMFIYWESRPDGDAHIGKPFRKHVSDVPAVIWMRLEGWDREEAVSIDGSSTSDVARIWSGEPVSWDS